MLLRKTGTAFAVLLLLCVSFNAALSLGTVSGTASVFAPGDYERTYSIHDDRGDSRSFSMSIPEETYRYYKGQSHSWYSYSDLEKFVTPQMFTNLVLSLSDICTTDYSFIMAILEIAQQIPYKEHDLELFPVETMVENAGDCSDKSYVAASFLVAKGYYTVLLGFDVGSPYGIGVSHLAIGVAASVIETDYTAYYFEYEGKKYYYCECTTLGWRIGELPPELEDEEALIIEVGGHRQAQIHATPLDSDGDGLTDRLEQIYGTNPHKSDTDNDGLTDYYEIYISLTDPLKADSDFDGLNDGAEIAAGTNPLNSDSDGDGLTDGEEKSLRTNPLKVDTDGDLWSDSIDPTPTDFFFPNLMIIAAGCGVFVIAILVKRRKRVPIMIAPPTTVPSQHCPTCGNPLVCVDLYQRWYCLKC